MTVLPMLFKKTSTGAIQFWQIEVAGSSIITRYGQAGTENPQETLDLIAEGKNLGRANATTAVQQAELEAKAKWTKQLKKGYVKSQADAEAGVLDEVIEGGINPMLAHKYTEHGHKIKFPCLGQPKLDGIRCTIIKEGNNITMWTRTRKPIRSVPHIVAAVKKQFPGDVTLDGELYNHDYKDDFENIVELVRPDEPGEEHEVVQYHIYDKPGPGTNRERDRWLTDNIPVGGVLVKVETFIIESAADVDIWHDRMVELGYEGLMLRNMNGLYVNKRSYDLLKYKKFETDEFEITGIEEGRGRLMGHVGKFLCVTKDGLPFKAKLKGSLKYLKKCYEHHELWKGKILTVQYQNWTQDKRPRFPVGIAIRDYE